MLTVDDLIKVLQASVAPVVLISGIGLLLLTLTNRLGRANDRIRQLCQDVRKAQNDDDRLTKEQIHFLHIRCKYLQSSIIFSIVSVVGVSIIIFILFSIYTFHLNLIGLVQILFCLSLVSLTLSLLYFLRDVFLALDSLEIEMASILPAFSKGPTSRWSRFLKKLLGRI